MGSYTDPAASASMGSGVNLSIGRSHRSEAEGAMDDFRVYDRALSDSEIAALAGAV